MTEHRTPKNENPAVDISAVIGPAPGGSLSDYVSQMKPRGQPCFLSADGRHAWLPDARWQLLRFPLDCTEPADRASVREVLRQPQVWVASYLLDSDAEHPSNCEHLLCRDSHYDIARLPPNARRDIRRGLRSFTVRLCTADELAEKGYRAWADTNARHGYEAPPAEGCRRLADARRNSPFYDIWGAWKGEELVAWLSLSKVDNWAVIHICNSCTSALRDCPNNALVYSATQRLLVEEKRVYVSYGMSSLRQNQDMAGLHKFKARMGYEARPVRRMFVAHPLLRPLLKPRLASWMWDRLASMAAGKVILQKVAMLSRQLSGREEPAKAGAEDESSSGGDEAQDSQESHEE